MTFVELMKYALSSIWSSSRCKEHHEENLFFWLGFTPCKAEEPLEGMELQEKEERKKKKKNMKGMQENSLERT